MSILIKGIEMPTNCGMCWALDDYGDYPRCRITEEQRGYTFPIREKRMDNCPLVPLPPHGRLIDADAIGIAEHEERFVKRADRGDWMDEYIVGIVDGLHEAGRRIINAPTIIPAEEGET